MGIATRGIIAVVVIAALAVGGYAVFHKNASTVAPGVSNTPSASRQQTNDPSTSQLQTASIAATITFNGNGFSPSLTTVKTGDTVQVTNKSSQELDFDSDPHPTHTDEPELNVGPISPSASKTFTVTKAGHWGYHDHLNPSITGALDVE